MKMNHQIEVKSKMSPVVEVDFSSGAVYVRFASARAKVEKTVIRSEWPHVAIDLDAEGEVVGVEAIGLEEISISSVLKLAQVKASEKLLHATRYFSAGSVASAATA